MSEDAIRQWLIDCFGQVQGELAWQQLKNLPAAVQDALMQRSEDELPKPEDVRNMLNFLDAKTMSMPQNLQAMMVDDHDPIDIAVATNVALQSAKGDNDTVNAQVADAARRALSHANLWLDTACNFDPAKGNSDVLSREAWVRGSMQAWAKLMTPISRAAMQALVDVMRDRFEDSDRDELIDSYLQSSPFDLPEQLQDPTQVVRLLASSSYSMGLGKAAGSIAHEVYGSFDQAIALLQNPAGGLIAYNCLHYAQQWDFDYHEVLDYIALREVAHARLFAAIPWLMPRVEALIIKYSGDITMDLDALEHNLRDMKLFFNSDSSGTLPFKEIMNPDTPEQQQVLRTLETLLALIEGWVDCVTWRAGMAHIVHLDRLSEIWQRRRAALGPAEVTFRSLLGLQLNPARVRQAAKLWQRITTQDGIQAREALWAHPDLLPHLTQEDADQASLPTDHSNNTEQNYEMTDLQGLSNVLQEDDASQKSESETEHEQSDEINSTSEVDTAGNAVQSTGLSDVTESYQASKANEDQPKASLNNLVDMAKAHQINWDEELAKLLNHSQPGGQTTQQDNDVDDSDDSASSER